MNEMNEEKKEMDNSSGVSETGDQAHKRGTIKKAVKDVEDYWNMLGPGLTTGAADDDPSGIATYSQVGAKYGFQLIWLSVFTFPLMGVIQEMCARIGIVTGRGLAANIRQYYSRRVLYGCTFLLVAANVFNIGADFGAMAKGAELLWPNLPFSLLIIFFGAIGLILQIFTTYGSYAKYLKYLALVLLSYVVTALFVHIDWPRVLFNTFVPHLTFSKEQILLVCAVLGTTISPYLFFWQTSQEVEEEKLRDTKNRKNEVSELSKLSENVVPENSLKSAEENTLVKKSIIKNMRVDVWVGMFISNIVMFFIIAMCAATLFQYGSGEIKTAADAASALRPFAGDFAYVLFAIGIIGTGMLAIPVLAGSSAYAVSESMGWKFGLDRKLKEAYAFYGVIAAATIVGICLNFIGLDPIKALIYSAVANGIVAPVVLFVILQMSSREDIMGSHKNGTLSKWIGWVTFVFMLIAALAAVWSLIGPFE